MTDAAVRDDEWEREHLYVLYYSNADGLGLCGCGSPEAAYDLIRDLLNLAPLYQGDGWRKAEQLIGTDGAVHIVLGQLDRVGLIEHGGVITGSWLTDKGRYVRYLIGRHDWDDVDMVGFPHDGQDCDASCWVAPTGLDLSDPAPPERAVATHALLDASGFATSDGLAAQMRRDQARLMDQVETSMLLYGEATVQMPLNAPPTIRDVFTAPESPFPRFGEPWDRRIADLATIGFGRPSPLGWFPELEIARLDVLALLGGQEVESVTSRSARFADGCHQTAGTWIHGRPHSCPVYARGWR